MQADVSPPEFLRLAGNPLRWRLLSALAHSDLRVSDLSALADQPQNAVSYHLARLRAGGLVSMRRSSADGRDSYYRVELPRCAQLLAATGTALHPGLATGPVPPTAHRPRRVPVRVLFLCTGNSTRSQIAEALLQRAAADRVQVVSAGSDPKAVHRNTVRVMREYGIDMSRRRSKHLDEFTGRHFDYVITLCDKVREICPEFSGAEAIHWSIPDPAAEDSSRSSYPAFRAVATDLQTRIHFLVRQLFTAGAAG